VTMAGRDNEAIESELNSLNLVKSVVQDPFYERSIEFVIQTLGWVLDSNSSESPSKNIASQYKDREAKPQPPKLPPNITQKAGKAPPEPTVSQPTVTIVMEIDGDRFIVPPFPFREPRDDNENVAVYLKDFVETLKAYVENVFGQVTVKEE